MLSQYEIIGPNGVIKYSVPTQKSTRKGLYKEVLIDYTDSWQDEQWKSITNAYKKSPFFQYYDYKIEPVFKTKTATLMDFNFALIEVITKCLRAEILLTKNAVSEAYYSDLELKEILGYPQVYDTKLGFVSNLSILDLLFNLGPETLDYLVSETSS